MTDKKKNIRLFFTAYMQVFLVGSNTFFIAKLYWIGIAAASFGISFLWAINVKKISASTLMERIVYSLGAALGAVSGVFLSKIILSHL